ncbi:nodulation-signaling pathway 2 protein-like, partial [Phalaenopsis equestris]|uniref:nodulation-signaling pathway 2 protein-like n=1 Tax=Phalaenopsis equestris TaxID=78828 RepID=UPI0009E4C2AC
MEHMEVDMEHMMNFVFSGCSSASSTTTLGDVNWVDWSPAIDWGCLSVDDDFSGLLEHYGLPCTPAANDWSTNVSPASTNCPGTPVEDLLPLPAAESSRDDDKGLRLVHLLMAAAEALTGANKCGDLARVILIRLRELLSHGGATNIERLAEHFTDALQRLLDGVGRHDDLPPNPGEVIEAFQLLQDMSPYVKFGHFTANQAILEAVAGERRVHIVDYDIMEGVQWASLIQAMVSQQE